MAIFHCEQRMKRAEKKINANNINEKTEYNAIVREREKWYKKKPIEMLLFRNKSHADF